MKKLGFTLAEVLITLGVIGIVAAMTIPTLAQNYKKREYSTRLKKFYSTMEQVIRLSEIDNGNVGNWSKVGCATCYLGDGDDVTEAIKKDREQVTSFYKKYIKPYLKVNQENFEYNASYHKAPILIYLNDGSTFTMHNGVCTDIRYDVNGIKNPNTLGRDIFGFIICPISEYNYGFNENQKLRPLITKMYAYDSNGNLSREKLLKRCKDEPSDCSALLMYDGWEFKDDYPYKL